MMHYKFFAVRYSKKKLPSTEWKPKELTDLNWILEGKYKKDAPELYDCFEQGWTIKQFSIYIESGYPVFCPTIRKAIRIDF